MAVNYVELVGPPGAGKTTIRKHLLSDETLYGGIDDGAVERVFSHKAPDYIGGFFSILPPRIKKFFTSEVLQYRLTRNRISEFVDDYPKFVPAVSKELNQIENEKGKVFHLCLRSAERYQIGVQSVENDEALCVDEGFFQRALAIAWRKNDCELPNDSYFHALPLPDILIHITAPPEICLTRQKDRRRIAVEREWVTDVVTAQRKLNDLTENLLPIADAFNIPVITIESTGTIAQSVNKIQLEIKQML